MNRVTISMISPIFALAFSFPFFLFAGLIYENVALLFVAGVEFFLVFAAWAFGSESVKRLTYKRTFSPRAFEGEWVEVSLALSNRSVLPACGVELSDRFQAQDVLAKEISVPGDLKPWTQIEVKYHGFCFRHRGEYAVGPLEVRFSDPLGLFRRRKSFREAASFTVLPKPLPLTRLALDGRNVILPAATVERQTRGQSLKFYGVREYRRGDSLRFIDWKASARIGELFVRQFEASVSSQITVFLDAARVSLSGLGAETTVEYGIRAAAAIAAASVSQGHEIQLLSEGERPYLVPMGSGDTHLSYVLCELASVKPRGKVEFPELITRYIELVPQGSQVFLIMARTGEDERALGRSVSLLNARYTQVSALIVDDRSFVQHTQWKECLPQEKWPPVAALLSRMGARVRLIERGEDLRGQLQES